MAQNDHVVMHKFVTSILLLFVCLCINHDLKARESDYQIEISKSAQELSLKKGNQIVMTYRIALGSGGKGAKRQLGDKKTPVGNYQLVEFKADSKFYYFMQIDYPNLLDAWYGYKNEIITATEFKQIATAFKNKQMPPQDTALGGYIGIHGLGKVTDKKLDIHDMHNWTEGCVALKNEEINDLRKYVSIGTQVIINE